MEVESTNSDTEADLKTLQECNAVISKLNQNLQTTLTNLDTLSESINKYIMYIRIHP